MEKIRMSGRGREGGKDGRRGGDGVDWEEEE
jgi:hypothetical protein